MQLLTPSLQSVILPYLDDIFELLGAYWNTDALPDVLTLLCEISSATSEGLKVHLPALIPNILSLLYSDFSDQRKRTRLMLQVCNLGW
jgi:hypothetical protein